MGDDWRGHIRRRLLGFAFIVPGCEGNHVVERGCFHSCVFIQNKLHIIAHNISRGMARDAWLQG